MMTDALEAVIVYSGGGVEVVASATKQGWVWRHNAAGHPAAD